MTIIRVTDYETETHPYYGATASPHCPENYIVEAAWQDFDASGNPLTDIVSHRFASRAEADKSGWLGLDGVDILVAHNAPYELSWWLARYRDEFLAFYNRGGRVLCTAMAEYLLSHQQELYPALNDVSPRYGGTHKVDAVKLLWEQGTLTSDIDPDLLHYYLCDPEVGDIANTVKVFFGQRHKLLSQGMWNMYLTRCDALVSYAMCMDAGLYINTEVAERNLAEHTKELADLEQQAQALIPSNAPRELEFNWSSLYHRSALLFGGPVKYKLQVPYDPPKFVKADFWNVAGTLVPVVEGAEPPAGAEVYKSGKNKGLTKVVRADTDVLATKWGEDVYNFPGLIDLDNLPQALADKFASPKKGRPGEYVTALTLCDNETPVYGTGEEVLLALEAHGLDAAKALARRAVLTKDIGTYYRQVTYNANGEVKDTKGMLQYVTPKGIIHHTLNATSTVTSRLSHARPNMGNLPRGDKDGDGAARSRVKEMFTSRFGDDGVIIESDYSALEVVMLAALSRDTGLLKHLQDGTDMHCLRLANKLGEPYEDVLAKCQDHAHPEHGKYKQMRTEIKPVAFAAQYGASAQGLAFATGVSVEFAEQFLEGEAKLFPRAIAFRQVVRDAVEESSKGCIEREQGPEGWRVYRRGYWTSPGATRYSFRQHAVWNKEARTEVMDFKPTQIANYWNQGEAAYLMAVAMARCGRWIAKKQFFSNAAFPKGRAFMINNVHDAVYFDVHKSVLAEVAETSKKIMESTPVYMSKYLGYNIADVPFPAAVEYGPNMANKQHFESENKL